jgi:hypothetical protein
MFGQEPQTLTKYYMYTGLQPDKGDAKGPDERHIKKRQ